MLFPKEHLIDLVECNCGTCYEVSDREYMLMEHRFAEQHRWVTVFKIVFKFNDKYYMSYYSVGSTEIQDESPYEYEDDLVECPEVKPVEHIEIKYILVDNVNVI